jgi:nucleotide-binding universal stress UspA family protein
MSNYLIVVGVDGSPGGQRALDWAVREAANRGGTVQAVTAWRWDGIESGPGGATNPADERARAVALLDSEIRGLATRHPSAPPAAPPAAPPVAPPVASEVVEGRPAEVLTAAAQQADLLVLGSHGHSRLRHTVLGSVSEECVRMATCPVVVIPVPVPARPPAEPALRN